MEEKDGEIEQLSEALLTLQAELRVDAKNNVTEVTKDLAKKVCRTRCLLHSFTVCVWLRVRIVN